MLANRWLPPWSLRGRLSATALAGLTTTVVLTVLLLLTASSASRTQLAPRSGGGTVATLHFPLTTSDQVAA